MCQGAPCGVYTSTALFHQPAKEASATGRARLARIQCRTARSVSSTTTLVVSMRSTLQRGSSWSHVDQRTRCCGNGRHCVMTWSSHCGSAACSQCHDAQLKVCWVGGQRGSMPRARMRARRVRSSQSSRQAAIPTSCGVDGHVRSSPSGEWLVSRKSALSTWAASACCTHCSKCCQRSSPVVAGSSSASWHSRSGAR